MSDELERLRNQVTELQRSNNREVERRRAAVRAGGVHFVAPLIAALAAAVVYASVVTAHKTQLETRVMVATFDQYKCETLNGGYYQCVCVPPSLDAGAPKPAGEL